MSNKTKFKYLDADDDEPNWDYKDKVFSAEIAYQLKRIADILEEKKNE